MAAPSFLMITEKIHAHFCRNHEKMHRFAAKRDKIYKYERSFPMAVTISMILSLPSFRDAVVLTGFDYLDNIVTQVSTADAPITDADYAISKPGDFYLSGFYFGGHSVESMIQYLNPMVATHSSGVCILDEYVSGLPEEVLRYCNDHRLPIILNSAKVPYAQVIREIMELIIADGQNMLLESEFASIAADTIDEKRKLAILKNLNPHFQANLSVFYIYFKEGSPADHALYDFFNKDILCSALYFQNGLIGLVSYGDAPEPASSRIAYYAGSLPSSDRILGMGLSEPFIKLHNISKALNQAILAAKVSLGTLIKYEELGVMKLLMLLSDHAELEEFYEDIILSIKDYDAKNNSQLYETMCAYIKCHYQYRETAKSMFIHENTVRYRIGKAKEMIEKKAPDDDFRETFSIALKCQDILSIYSGERFDV